MQEHYLDKDKIYYRTNEFKPGRLTLVFVHGVSGSSSAWFNYEPIFENKYNILIYDIRGHGLSKKYPNYEDYAIKNFANDLAALVKYLQIKKNPYNTPCNTSVTHEGFGTIAVRFFFLKFF